MRFSVLFRNRAAANRAQHQLAGEGLLQWNDVTSVHNERIQMAKLPLAHTSARRGAVLGGLVIGLSAALILVAIAAISGIGFGVGPALAFGLAVGVLYGGVFGAIAYSTRPANFIRDRREQLAKGSALLVCDIEDRDRAEDARERLESHPAALAA